MHLSVGTNNAADCCQVFVFQTSLGWMSIITTGQAVRRLSFGHASQRAALQALGCQQPAGQSPSPWQRALARRFQAYADGTPDDFLDVDVDWQPPTDFGRRVLERCRRIPYGATMTYGQLAKQAGRPGAARAVGNCMARNQIPLIIPCHRVTPAGGAPGAYSAPGGARMKLRLLDLEAACVDPRRLSKSTNDTKPRLM